MGIKASKFKAFWEDLEEEYPWDILILQEFTAARDVEVFVNKTAHKVILAAPCEGSRACGIVIHRRVAHCYIGESDAFKPRACSTGIHGEGWNIRITAGHLAANYNKEEYGTHIKQL